ncbi:MAG: FAD-binding oxidoreductase [Segetibacter sp.]|jgi:glycine/D-amino acid oxidase-like deaminating enzyme|nr:FAD-binding oxidoreductase [Segetibacter sp.]
MNEQVNFSSFLSPPLGAGGLDFLIVGQGLCGTFLSYYLLKAGKSVVVIDDNKPFTASKVASGVINPVTGRRIVRTWMIEDLLPFALQAYGNLGDALGKSLIRTCSLLDFHPSLQMKEAFDKRLNEEPEYLHETNESDWKTIFNFYFGAGEISPCLLIDIHSMLSGWRNELQKKHLLIEENLDVEKLVVSEQKVTYKDLTATKIIFCDGVNGISSPYFKNLPYSANKGEAIIARIPELDVRYIYKQGLSIVPWQDDFFWIGSTYEWNFTDDLPTATFKEKVNGFLKYFLKIPFEIVDQIASVRPANMERRPFVGLHPGFLNVGILNGMGTKGCSLAPFFAKQFADFLVAGKPISPEADVRRFERILERKMN